VNPPYRPYTLANPFKFFLDMLPSSSKDVTRTMRGQPRRRSHKYPEWRERCGEKPYFFYYRKTFYSKDVFCENQIVFVAKTSEKNHTLWGCT